jgi:hypothetical protein
VDIWNKCYFGLLYFGWINLSNCALYFVIYLGIYVCGCVNKSQVNIWLFVVTPTFGSR